LASTKPAKQSRRLREANETVRERSLGVTANPAVKPSITHLFFHKIGAFGFWKPFRFVGRFLGKYIIPPYFKNSWKELRMVTWPNRKQTRQLTFAVIIFSIIFGVLVAVVDFGLDKLFKKVILRI
jgi:preprotein translocase subunit SecE